MMGNDPIKAQVNLGVLRVRMSGVAKQDSSGREVVSVTTPTVADATAALRQAARVSGADGLVRVGSDYRRTAIASGPLSTQTVIEVQAWGTPVRNPDPSATDVEKL